MSSSEKEKFKKEYIEKCEKEIDKIRSEIIKKIINNEKVYNIFTYDNHNFISFSSYYECYLLHEIEEIIEKIKKNKEIYENFYTKYENMGEITNETKKQIIENFKYMIQKLNEKDRGLDFISQNNNIYTLNYLVENLKKYQNKKDGENLLPSEQSLHNADKKILQELSKNVEEMLEENNRIINTQNNNISHEDILNYYDKLINLGKKILKYAKILSTKVSQENYKSNFYLYSKSCMNGHIKENLKQILNEDIFSSIPKYVL